MFSLMLSLALDFSFILVLVPTRKKQIVKKTVYFGKNTRKTDKLPKTHSRKKGGALSDGFMD